MNQETAERVKYGYLVVAALLFALWTITGCGEKQSLPSNDPWATPGPKIITQQEYNQITPGMAKNEVIRIIGSPGKVQMNINDSDGEMLVLIWDNPDLGYACVRFQNGIAQDKNCMGLEW